ncbi:MAG: hypothetical protein ABI960_07380 [Candidatus Eisenbacteria bacterium]
MILASNPHGSRRRELAGALTAAALVLLLAGPAAAQMVGNPKIENNGPAQVLTGPDCDISNYKAEARQFSPPLSIPDNDPAGITTPPIILPADGDIIDDVVITMNLEHTWIGDLVIHVSYDPDCGGAAGPVTAVLLCRPDGSGDLTQTAPPCGSDAAALGCASDLSCNNTYAFSDEAVAKLGEDAFCGATSSTILPGGCYLPGTGGTPLAIFRGMPKGGCWTLTISDNAAIDTGALCSWAVYTRNQHPVPAKAASWGNVKHLYR